ncbi:MAG: hypothetical protein AB2L20_14875 [Mangrovibacterium sp.]
MKRNKHIEAEAARLVLGKRTKGFKIVIHYGILKIRTQIHYISAEDVIRISERISMINDYDPEAPMFQELMKNAQDMRYISQAIAIATSFPLKWLIRKAINALSYEDIEALWNVVKERMKGDRFFFIMESATSINLMRKMKEK